MIVFVVVVMK